MLNTVGQLGRDGGGEGSAKCEQHRSHTHTSLTLGANTLMKNYSPALGSVSVSVSGIYTLTHTPHT
jgi:hypothetical protein